MKKVVIYTDGSCLGNPGPGGWAAILMLEGTHHRREISGGFRLTTNNRMEVLAAIEGLCALKEPCAVSLVTDSRYLANAVAKGWLATWQKNGWRKADKKPVLNEDLWRRLAPLLANHNVSFCWVRGHAGNETNEQCDQLARTKAQMKNLPPDSVFENQQK